MKLARVKITYELLEEAIHLPPGMRIRRVIPPREDIYLDRMVELILEGDGLPVSDIQEGEPIPQVTGTIFGDGAYLHFEVI